MGEIATGDGISLDGAFDKYGVSVWAKESEIIFNDKYSYIDTMLESRVIKREIKYFRTEDETVKVTWNFDGLRQADVLMTEDWRGQENKWLVTNTVSINVEGKNKDLQIEAIVDLPNQSVRRFKTIPTITVNKEMSDAFGFIFGMQKQDIYNIDHSHSPQFSSVMEDRNPVTLLEFSSGKLIRIYCQDKGVGIQGVCDLCKIPNELEIDGRLIKNPQEWDNGNLKFRVLNFDADEALFGESLNRTHQCLIIEKMH